MKESGTMGDVVVTIQRFPDEVMNDFYYYMYLNIYRFKEYYDWLQSSVSISTLKKLPL